MNRLLRTAILCLSAMMRHSFAQDSALDTLISNLGSDDVLTRESATSKLLEAGEVATKHLKGALSNPDPEIRSRAAQLLTQLRIQRLSKTSLIESRQLSFGRSPARALAWDAPGKRLASATSSGRIQVINAASGAVMFALQTDLVSVLQIWFGTATDELWVMNDRVSCWNYVTGQMICVLQEKPEGLAVVSGPSVVAWITSNELKFLDLERRQIIASAKVGAAQPHSLTASVRSSQLYYVDHDGDPMCLSIRDGSVCGDAKKFSGASPNLNRVWRCGDSIVVQPDSGKGAIWNGRTICAESAVSECKVSPDESRAALCLDSTILEIRDSGGQRLAVHDISPRTIRDYAWSPDSSEVAIADDDGALEVWNPISNTLRSASSQPGIPLELAFSPSGAFLAATTRTVRSESNFLIQLSTGEIVELPTSRWVGPGLFGDQFARCASEGTQLIAPTGAGYAIPKAQPLEAFHSIKSAAIAPNGRLGALTRDGNSDVVLVDLIAGSELQVISIDGADNSIAWSPLSDQFAIATQRFNGNGDRSHLAVYDSRGLVKHQVDANSNIVEIGWNVSGSKLAWSSATRIHCLDVDHEFQTMTELEVASGSFGFVSDDLLIACTASGVQLWSVGASTRAKTWPEFRCHQLAVSPDRRTIALQFQHSISMALLLVQGEEFK